MTIKSIINTAINNNQQLQFEYLNHLRVVNPHHIGILHNAIQIHCFQVGGTSRSKLGWKNFKISEIKNIKLLSKKFTVEPTYNPQNSHYSKIYCQIDNKFS